MMKISKFDWSLKILDVQSSICSRLEGLGCHATMWNQSVSTRLKDLWHSGFLVKTSGGTLLSADVTNSCQKIRESLGLDFNRKVPIFIEPEELEVDSFLCT